MSQKLFRSLARPLKVDLDLCPVISRLEKGAELKRTTPFGAPRMSFLFGGEVDLQSRRMVARLGPGHLLGVLGTGSALASFHEAGSS